ncbi:MAG: hypothetical protein U1E25_15125 [Methylocystis sp.]
MTENIDWPGYQKALREGRALLETNGGYPAPLNEPIVVDAELLNPPLVTGNIEPFLSKSEIAAREQYRANIQAKVEERTKLLAYVYGIEIEGNQNFWYELASALAFQHVPGLRQVYEPPPKPRGKGAPKKYNFDDHFQIYVDVHDEIDRIIAKNSTLKRDRLANQAIKNLLHKNQFFKNIKTRKGANLGSAKTLYNDAKNVVKNYENPKMSLLDLGRLLAVPPEKETTWRDFFADMIKDKKFLFEEARSSKNPGLCAYRKRKQAKRESETIAKFESISLNMRQKLEKGKTNHPPEKVSEALKVIEEFEIGIADLKQRLGEIK